MEMDDTNRTTDPTAAGPIQRIVRVLCLDGGGMRGIYTVSYLLYLSNGVARKRGLRGDDVFDIGAAFDLIVGTSTGALLGGALAHGTELSKVLALYRERGREIFPIRLPNATAAGLRNVVAIACGIAADLRKRKSALKAGESALRAALEECFGDVTLGQLYENRRIALAIPSVNMATHRAWVFKTPHLTNSKHRDDRTRLVDACLASSAAPIYRALAALSPNGDEATTLFADGGVWANNAVLVGLVDALEMTSKGDRIEIYCLGTCPRPAGDDIATLDPNGGLLEWKFGGAAAGLAIDAQEGAFDDMARMLAKHVDRDCSIVRFARGAVPFAMMKYLELDDTSENAAIALMQQAANDADLTNSRLANEHDREAQLVNQLFATMTLRPPFECGAD